MRKIDMASWGRREHFEFFSKFEEPFFGIVSEIDCTESHLNAKKMNRSFFADYLHKSLVAVNEIEEFRCRIEGDDVVVFDKIHASPTIGREDGTFGFSFIEYDRDFEVFNGSLQKAIEVVRNFTGLMLTDNAMRSDTVHYSTFPWKNFTGLTHARCFSFPDSAPKITFGKAFEREGRRIMAVSLNAHHGLMDGMHVAKFLDIFQNLMNGSEG